MCVTMFHCSSVHVFTVSQKHPPCRLDPLPVWLPACLPVGARRPFQSRDVASGLDLAAG